MRELLIGLTTEMNRRGIFYEEAVREFKKVFIVTALRDTEGNLCRAAKRLGMHRNTLARNVAELQINVKAIRSVAKRPGGTTEAPQRRVA
jgi:DNA-binding NtrC family response regulator